MIFLLNIKVKKKIKYKEIRRSKFYKNNFKSLMHFKILSVFQGTRKKLQIIAKFKLLRLVCVYFYNKFQRFLITLIGNDVALWSYKILICDTFC